MEVKRKKEQEEQHQGEMWFAPWIISRGEMELLGEYTVTSYHTLPPPILLLITLLLDIPSWYMPFLVEIFPSLLM